VIAASADTVVTALYGRNFAGAAALLPILVLAQSLISAGIVLRQALLAHGREYAIIGTGAASLAIKVSTILGLAWLFGLKGAAYGTLISALAMFAIDLWLSRRAGLSLDQSRFVLGPLACVGAAFAAIELWPHGSRVLAFVTGLVAFTLAAAIFRVFPLHERRFLLQIVRPDRTQRRGDGSESK
jgi:O-antigen/teichoic acid export membrane protein